VGLLRPNGSSGARLLVRRLAIALPLSAVAVALLVFGAKRDDALIVGLALGTFACSVARMGYAVVLEGRHHATRSQALTDDLTGLGNRRRLIDDLTKRLETATPESPAVLALFDLNGFKHFNDTYGHPAGDALLCQLAQRLTAAVGTHGSAYRLGGDEFCALLQGDPRTVDGLMPELERALSDGETAVAVSSSYGVALLPHEAGEVSAALALADRRMYERKMIERRSTRLQMRDLMLAVVQEQHPDLHGHSADVSRLCREVGKRVGLQGAELELLVLAAELHDVGKVAIPDSIISKAGPLTDREWQLMRTHTEIGERMLLAAPPLAPVAGIVRGSHERWDGSGYPDGLAGTAIPLESRVIAACDAFDAMVSDRPYRKAISRSEAEAELARNAGTQFDPAVVEALAAVLVDGEVALQRIRPMRASPSETRLSAIASLRGLLEVTRLVRRAGSLETVLDAIADTVSESLGLDTVVINLRLPGSEMFEVTTVRGRKEVREGLLGTKNSWDEWEPLLDKRFERRGAYHIRAGEYDWTALEGKRVVVGAAAGDEPWLWHPEDELFVPFYGSNGKLLGIFSLGDPRSGLRPSDDEVDVLVAIAEHTAVAVEGLHLGATEPLHLAQAQAG
jgi:diguanylate cyclase (GGDEF)-like protein